MYKHVKWNKHTLLKSIYYKSAEVSICYKSVDVSIYYKSAKMIMQNGHACYVINISTSSFQFKTDHI